ncbi:MAG: hypothetical protein CMN30_09735 [Sandaracinus sp.]|nr:hypothetical protein [Sandaracinus sp.]MAQ15060.1 hypothetical protein [Sandaracinus sp.]|tara:strand:- start:1130 stop:1879 length:750 start_codon:yes stop_codon:yes gene_type:complete
MRRNDPRVVELDLVEHAPLPATSTEIIETLAPLVTPERMERFREVAAGRLASVAPVLESIADPHNASAILRSADAFGVQRVHIIPAPSGFHVSRPISKNAHRWLELKRHDAAEACADALEADGYRIYVASMEGTVTPRELSRESKVAVVFGNEHSGPSPAMRARAAGTYAIPMSGFVESLNVSVAAAITLQALTQDRPGELDDPAQAELIARWLLNTVRDGERVVRAQLGLPIPDTRYAAREGAGAAER